MDNLPHRGSTSINHNGLKRSERPDELPKYNNLNLFAMKLEKCRSSAVQIEYRYNEICFAFDGRVENQQLTL